MYDGAKSWTQRRVLVRQRQEQEMPPRFRQAPGRELAETSEEVPPPLLKTPAEIGGIKSAAPGER